MKKFFIDTEFTNFHDKDLISIGVVDMDSENYFYLENKNYFVSEVSDFVYEIVLPQLNFNRYGYELKELESKLFAWLSGFGEEYCFIGDSDLDMQVLNKVFRFGKEFVGFVYIEDLLLEGLGVDKNSESDKYCLMEKFSEYCDRYYIEHNGNVHHALDDALANRWAYLKMLGFI